MKKLLFLIQILLLMCTAYSQEKVFPITQINKRFVKVDEKMFVDKFEVTVNDYLRFLNEKKVKGGDISKLIYDSICWRYIGPEYLVYEELYFNHNSFINYPMVGVSNFAAQEFCKWLTDKYNSDPNRKYNKVVFRLPTEQEFIKVALSKFDSLTIYPWGYSGLFNSKKDKCCNFFEIDQTRIDFSNEGFYLKGVSVAPMTEPVYHYQPNPYGIFNIVGNVSEMIQENGNAMGGDFLSSGYNVRIKSKKKFTEPTCNVGFRVYMEILN